MEKIISLCRNSEFQKLYKRGRSAVRSTIVVYAIKGKGSRIRLGITVGKKLGGAVCRNRAKRRIKELFRVMQPEIINGVDVCIVARSRVLTAPHKKLVADFKSAMEELGLLENK